MVKKKNNIPSLRFSDFNGLWEEKKLKDIAAFSKGKGISKIDISEDGETECIRYGELYTHYDEVINNVRSRTNIDKKELVLSEANDVIIPASGETQIDIATASCVLKSGIALGGDLNIIKTKNNGVFLSYYLNNRKKLDIANLAQGISVVHLYSSQLALLNLNLPSLPEQQKIASFLTSVDERIQQLSRKKNLLEQYKKGVMQKIFSREIKFKDNNGKDFPNWEEKTFSEFLALTLREIPKPSSNYLAIGIRSHFKGTFQKAESEPEKIAMDKLYIVKENDLIVNITFAWEGAIAIVKKDDEGGLVSHRFPTYIFNQSIVDHKYFQYIFGNKKFKMMLDLISPGGAGRNRVMNKTDFLKLKWTFPCSSEQQKISSFLISIDKKIGFVNTQFQKTQAWKKGLLQKMFV